MQILLRFNQNVQNSCGELCEFLKASKATLEPHLKSLFKSKIIVGKIDKVKGLQEETVFTFNQKFVSPKINFHL